METAEGRGGKELLLVGEHQSDSKESPNISLAVEIFNTLVLLCMCRWSKPVARSRYPHPHALVGAARHYSPQGEHNPTAPKGAPRLPIVHSLPSYTKLKPEAGQELLYTWKPPFCGDGDVCQSGRWDS